MLATLGTTKDIVDEEGWAFEMKWDGIRAIARVDDGTVTLTSRNGKNLTATYPELAVLADVVAADSATLDGEIVAFDTHGRPDFGLLQTRMNLSSPRDVDRAAKAVPVRYLVFDALEVDGRSLLDAVYDERRSVLEKVVNAETGGAVQVPAAFAGDLEHAVSTSKELGLEGIVAKERDSRYGVGRRSRAWIKIKHHHTQEVVIGGWRTGNGRRRDSIGSLLMGIPEGRRLRYVGRVGTGFVDRELDELRTTLARRTRTTSPLDGVPSADARDAHWVRPDLVGEVEFAEWTSTGRLRQPSWRGWRPDKSPGDVRPE